LRTTTPECSHPSPTQAPGGWDVVVGGQNFGTGSSREQAGPDALKYAGSRVWIAASFVSEGLTSGTQFVFQHGFCTSSSWPGAGSARRLRKGKRQPKVASFAQGSQPKRPAGWRGKLRLNFQASVLPRPSARFSRSRALSPVGTRFGGGGGSGEV